MGVNAEVYSSCSPEIYCVFAGDRRGETEVQAGILSSYSISFMGYNETVPVG
jgi:hypothetical protein